LSAKTFFSNWQLNACYLRFDCKFCNSGQNPGVF